MAQNRNRKRKRDNRGGRHEALGTVLCAVSAFLLVCIVIKPILGIFSEAIFGVMLGLFGIASYPMLLLLLLLGIFLMRGKTFSASTGSIVGIVLAAVFALLILQLATTHSFLTQRFSDYIDSTYSCKYSAGGILLGLVAFALKSLITEVACYILLSIALVIDILVLCDAFNKVPELLRSKRDRRPEPEEVKPDPEPRPAMTREEALRVRYANMAGPSLFFDPIRPHSDPFETESGTVTDLPMDERRTLGDYMDSPVMTTEKPQKRSEAANVAWLQLYGEKDAMGKKSAEAFDTSAKEPVRAERYDDVFDPSDKVRTDAAAARPRRIDYEGTPNSLGELCFPSEKNRNFNDQGIDFAPKDPERMRPVRQNEPAVPEPPLRPIRRSEPTFGISGHDLPMTEKVEIFDATDSFNVVPPPEPEPAPEELAQQAAAKKLSEREEIINAYELNTKITPHVDKKEEAQSDESDEREGIINGSISTDAGAPVYINEKTDNGAGIINGNGAGIINGSAPEPGIIDIDAAAKMISGSDIFGGSLTIEDGPAVDLSETHDNVTDMLSGGDLSGMYVPAEEEEPIVPAVKPAKPKKVTQQIENQLSIDTMLKEQAEESIVATQTRRYKKYNYVTPPIDLLKIYPKATAIESEIKQNIETLERVVPKLIKSPVKVMNVITGPQVALYEIDLPSGTPVNTIKSRTADLAFELASESGVRVQAPIPGKRAVGIEVPNREKSIVGLREVVESSAFQKAKSQMVFSVGKDIGGAMIVCDLEKVPHLLIAGATGSGKSAGLSSLIISLLYKASPEDLRFILIDPKRVEFSKLRGMPHMLIENPVVNPNEALNALKWAANEMERRYTILSKYSCSKLAEYNSLPDVASGKVNKLPHIIIVIDELANLMQSSVGKEIESKISSIAALARAAGIHLIVATQRPSTDVITGTIKANLTSRIAFKVQDATNSRIILDDLGAEALTGNGDMLFFPAESSAPLRVQGSYVTGEEVVTVVTYLKEHYESDFDTDAENFIYSKGGDPSQGGGGGGDQQGGDNSLDPLCAPVMAHAIKTKQISVSVVQRRFSIGYARAARIIDSLEALGYIGPLTGNNKPREVKMTPEQFREVFGHDIDANQ